jgi:quercetin dioxygenase-like cupin family protein
MSRWLLSLALACAVGVCQAEPDPQIMTITRDADLQWQDNPHAPGLRQAVLFGDPSKPGLYVIRVRFPPGVMSSPHWHPEARYVSVVKGTWWVGTGPVWDRSATTPLPAGSFAVHQPNKIHFDGAKDEEVIVQIVGIGPSGTVLVDASGAPR